MDGGKPVAMLGVVPVDLLSGTGIMWMLGTDEVFKNWRALLELGPLVLDDWLQTFRRLDNLISVENTKAIRVLKWWGCEIGNKVQVHGGVEFVPFHIERAAIQDARLVA